MILLSHFYLEFALIGIEIKNHIHVYIHSLKHLN